MELIYMIVGVVIIYSVIHFFIIQANKKFEDRTTYEKVVTWVAGVSICLEFLAVIGLT